jgi:hypothetical protein
LKEALLFVNKKKQKNFDFLAARATLWKHPPFSRSFSVFFFKKELLAYSRTDC